MSEDEKARFRRINPPEAPLGHPYRHMLEDELRSIVDTVFCEDTDSDSEEAEENEAEHRPVPEAMTSGEATTSEEASTSEDISWTEDTIGTSSEEEGKRPICTNCTARRAQMKACKRAVTGQKRRQRPSQQLQVHVDGQRQKRRRVAFDIPPGATSVDIRINFA